MMGTDVTMTRYIIGNVSSAVCFGTARCYISASSWRPPKKKREADNPTRPYFSFGESRAMSWIPFINVSERRLACDIKKASCRQRKIDSGRIREIWWEKQPSWKVGGEKKKAVNTWHKGEETTGENHNRDEDVQSFPTASSASIRSFQSQRIVIVCACRIITGNGWCQLGADKRRYKRERVSLYYRVCLNHRRMRNERRPSFPQRNTWLAPIDIPHHRI